MSKLNFFPPKLEEYLSRRIKQDFVLLETARVSNEDKRSFLFEDPAEIIIFNHGDDTGRFFNKCERYLKEGFWLAGYFSYEFGYYLEDILSPLRGKYDFPLVWLGAFKNPGIISRGKKEKGKRETLLQRGYFLGNFSPNISKKEYKDNIARVKNHIKNGFTYQVNYTFKVKFDFHGSVLGLYRDLKNSQPTSYTAFISAGGNYVISASPELFFRRRRGVITSKPMKGTAPRGTTRESDRLFRVFMRRDPKTKAENIMIVDLLRNDFSRISREVSVPKVFEVEKHGTLYQMTSTIKGRINPSVGIKDVFTSIFPCGSVTGAPKIKTMEIIKSLEKEPRGIYTGAIGYISPNRDSCFNVAIRTVAIKDNKGELGVGGGVVIDSDPSGEYKEAMLKSRFLVGRIPVFSLFESVLWEKGKGYFLLGGHLSRLQRSSSFFSFPLDKEKVEEKLKKEEKKFKFSKYKVKIIVNSMGHITLASEAVKDLALPVRITISDTPVDPSNIFLYHKTTLREVYDKFRKDAVSKGFFDVIFLNTSGEVTEGAVSNIFIEKKGALYTPPVNCGLLPGVLRRRLIEDGRVKERKIYPDDINDAGEVYIGNSVRGLMKAVLG